MKKIYIFLCAALCCTALQAQLTGVKIYVDPGHGGFTSNDRHVATPGHYTCGSPLPGGWTGTDGFWESTSNLDKGFYLTDRLRERNAIVKMSRITNTEADDVDMQTLALDADSFGADVFISIHSNAANANANYLFLMYRSGIAVTNTSIAMAKACYPFMLDNPLNSWTSYYPYNAGNVKVDTHALGVQNYMTIAGFLSEGSFHDYVPETCRLLNMDYKNLEALRMFRYFVDYYGDAKETTGTIAGYVKTKDTKMQTVFGALSFTYHAGSDDQWHPLNGATVKLLDASGMSTLKTYTVDNEWNGIFVFYNLAPGNYKLQASKAGYTSETVGVTVTAAKTTNQKIFLKDENTTQTETPANYPDPEQDTGVVALNHYDFEQQGTTLSASWLNAGNIKRAIHRNGKLYVLTKDASPKIFIVNPTNLSLIREMDLTGVSGGTYSPLSDIGFTADNRLLACNKEWVVFGGAANFKMYIWENDNAAPSVFFTSNHSSNWSNGIMGETMTVSGTSDDCTIFVSGISRSGSFQGQVRISGFKKVKGGAVTAAYQIYERTFITSYTATPDNTDRKGIELGEDFQLMISPRSNDNIIITSHKTVPMEYKFDWGINQLEAKGDFAEKGGYNLFKTNGANYFRYAGKSYMAAPVAQTGRVSAGVVLFDITDGLNNAVKLSEQLPAAGLGATAAPYMTAYGTVDNYDITLAVLAEKQGFATFKTNLNPVSISVPKQCTEIRVYPNPVQDIVHIESDFAIESIQLIDLTGRVVMTIPANQSSFDMSGVKAGSYILLVNNIAVKVLKK